MTKKEGFVLPAMDAEGKQFTIAKPGRHDWKSYFTSKDDDAGPPIVRGGGSNKVRLSWADQEDGIKTVNLSFAEPIEIGDGRAFYTGMTMDDTMNILVNVPANTPVENAGGTGNCNLVDTGAGFNMIVPADGDGTHDIDLNDAVPVASLDSSGYYDVDNDTGTISVSAEPGAAGWNLFDLAFVLKIMNEIPLGNPIGVMDIDPRAAEWLHPAWILQVSVDRQGSSGAAEFAGWFMLYRESIL